MTGLLHACGIAIGLLDRWSSGSLALRWLGGGISAAGAYLLAGLVT